MQDIIFKTYDIRGKVGTELQLDQVYSLACAIGFFLKEKDPSVKAIAVAMDGRTHSPIIKESLVTGLLDSGLDVIFVGICPTPVLYFSLFNIEVQAGIMITASHNPADYNGFKICLGTNPVWGTDIQYIRALYKQRKKIITLPGKYFETNLIKIYINFLKERFCHLIGSNITAIVDCGNATGTTVMPELINIMRWRNIELINDQLDGAFPNHDPDPTTETSLTQLRQKLSDNSFAFGAGLDGDCDRLAVLTSCGKLLSGDKLLAIFAKDILENNPNANIVYDCKSSQALIELLDSLRAHSHMSPSGHSLIKAKMKETGAILGGEVSCHFFFKDKYFGYDDGIYALVRLIEIIELTRSSVDDLIKILPTKITSPEYRIKCNEKDKPRIIASVRTYFEKKKCKNINDIDGVRVVMPYGWGIIRASNTQSVMSVRCESDTQNGLTAIKKDFYSVLELYVSRDDLVEFFTT